MKKPSAVSPQPSAKPKAKHTSAKSAAQPETIRYNLYLTIEMEVGKKLKPQRTHDGTITGFRLPDGRIAQPVLAFEIEDPKTPFPTQQYRDYSTSAELADLGFAIEDYDRTEFQKQAA
jgi:hypothetical protein